MNNSDNAGRVQKALLDLSRLILRKDAVPDDLMTSLKRLLRPADKESVSDFHYNALKHRLRSSILSRSLNASVKDGGPALVAKLEKHIDDLRRRGFRQLTPFLAVIEPLSFQQSRYLNVLFSASTPTELLSAEDKIWTDAGIVQPEGNENRQDANVSQKRNISEAKRPSDALTWVSRDIELKLLKDLLFIFQVMLQFTYSGVIVTDRSERIGYIRKPH